MTSSELVPFGKHKGKSVEVLMSDPGYREWVMAQPWFRERYPTIYQTIINYAGEPADTPEHNEMQAAFLEPTHRLALARRVLPKTALSSAAAGAAFDHAKIGHDGYASGNRSASQLAVRFKEHLTLEIEPTFSIAPSFEVDGWDVVYGVRPEAIVFGIVSLPDCICHCDHDRDCAGEALCRGGDNRYACRHKLCGTRHAPSLDEPWSTSSDKFWRRDHCNSECAYSDEWASRWLLDGDERIFRGSRKTIRVECKPDLGDDYPSVMRQITRYDKSPDDYVCLLVRRTQFERVKREQVDQMFASKGIKIVDESSLTEGADNE